MRWLSGALAACGLVLGIAGNAVACICNSLSPVVHYAAAKHVVIARIDSAYRHRETVVVRMPPGYPVSAAFGSETTFTVGSIRATFEITETLKGAPEDLAFVATMPSCALRLDIGVEYLLYVDDGGRVSSCGSRAFNWLDTNDVGVVRTLRLFEGRQPPATIPGNDTQPVKRSIRVG